MGMVRLVVETGRIRTKLDFHVAGGEYQTSTYTKMRRKSWGISGRASLIGRIFGISIGGGIRSINVSTYKKEH